MRVAHRGFVGRKFVCLARRPPSRVHLRSWGIHREDHTCLRRELAQHRVKVGPGLWIQQAAEGAHPVGSLASDRYAPPAGAVDVREPPIGIDQSRDPIGACAELFRAEFGSHGCQLLLGGLAGVGVDRVGQYIEEPADDPHVLITEAALSQCVGDIRKCGSQGLAGECTPWAEMCGVGEAAPGGRGSYREVPCQHFRE